MAIIVKIIKIFTLILPLLLSGITLIFILKKKLLKALYKPLDHKVHVFGKRLFGNNKTYCGLFIHVVISIFCCILLFAAYNNGFSRYIHPVFSHSPVTLGIYYAFLYTAGELVNSFVKRQLQIAPGAIRFGFLQTFFDLSDGIIFVAIGFILLKYVTLFQGIAAMVLGILFHFLTDVLMRLLKLKRLTQNDTVCS